MSMPAPTDCFHMGSRGSEVNPAASVTASRMTTPRARPNSAPRVRSTPPSPAFLKSLDTSAAASAMADSVKTNTTTKAISTRTSGVASDDGSASPTGAATAFAARKASTQPASERISRTKPRQMPHSTDSASTARMAMSR